MGLSPSREPVGFGIELELVGLPRHFERDDAESKWKHYQSCYDALEAAMEKSGIATTSIIFDRKGRFKKYPQNYQSWYLTYDTSIVGRNKYEAVPMEIVSRTFEIPQKDWMVELGVFWDAFFTVFEMETSNEHCGSHVHVAPLGSAYDMSTLRQIAYAVIIYEKHVLEILPESRRGCHYCLPNTSVSPALKQLFRHGRNQKSYVQLRSELNDIDTPGELCIYMQGGQDGSRNVLWNFKNLEGSKGTIEFRGLPGIRSAEETIHWVLFAIGFLLLAEEEDEFGSNMPFTYVGPGTDKLRQRTEELWTRIRQCCINRLTAKWNLPSDYENMLDEESRPLVRSGSRSSLRSSLGSVSSSHSSVSLALH
ncbi:hypothetical protein ACLMJK_003660 [Lecanora helva]